METVPHIVEVVAVHREHEEAKQTAVCDALKQPELLICKVERYCEEYENTAVYVHSGIFLEKLLAGKGILQNTGDVSVPFELFWLWCAFVNRKRLGDSACDRYRYKSRKSSGYE